MRLPSLRRRAAGGRLPSLGQDHRAGHVAYVDQIGSDLWLRTKPFSVPPSHELSRCLRSFAHIVDALRLGPAAEVLDVGCGPGWLSEYLARCGYHVTGVDISPDMVEIARQRIAAIPRLPGAAEPVAEFHVMHVHDLTFEERFDAAVLYDAMHHFDDERATLRAIRRALVPGGRIYIHEGSRPEPGSEGEATLIEEMERFGTLESPFDPDYLTTVVEDAGFTDVRRFLEVDSLVEIGPRSAWREAVGTVRRMRRPDTNTVIATNPLPGGGSGAAASYAARIEAQGPLADAGDGTLAVEVAVTNTGTHRWTPTAAYPYPAGTVTVAPYVRTPGGGRRELERVMLPGPVAPAERTAVRITVPRESLAGAAGLSVDLVLEGVAWFGDVGSTPLLVPAPA